MTVSRFPIDDGEPAVHRVPLPRGAVPHVRTGSQVRPDQVLASRREVGEPLRISLARTLGRRPTEVSELLLVTPGARLDPDQPIARGPDGREVRSPGHAIFLTYSEADGSALLVQLGAETSVIGHVHGTVLQVTRGFISVAVPGARLEGVGGTGDAVHGELAVPCLRH